MSLISWLGVFSRAETIRRAHDTIRYTIQCTRYDTFRDTFQWFAALSWEAETCDEGLRSGAPHSSCSSYNNGGLLGVFQVQCIWAKFTHLIWIYWLLMWYFVFLSNFGICYKCTVSYRYLLLRIAIHIGAPVYRCIVSALVFSPGYSFFLITSSCVSNSVIPSVCL